MIPRYFSVQPPYPGMALLPMGPRSRVLVAGSRGWRDDAAVRVALTHAWRDAGQPLTVAIGPTCTHVDDVAADWVAEHEVAGMELQRCRSLFYAETYDAEGRPDFWTWRVLAFVLNGSDGVTKCVDAARDAGLDVRVWEAGS